MLKQNRTEFRCLASEPINQRTVEKKDISERCINIPPSTEAEVNDEGDGGVERAGTAGMSERKSVDR